MSYYYYCGVEVSRKKHRFVINQINVEPFEEIRSDEKQWNIGSTYYIEDDEILKKIKGNNYDTFTLKAIVGNVNGVDIDSLIVKRNGNNNVKKFTLSPFDCELLGINYEPELEILSKNMNWKEQNMIVNRDFDKNNLSTYQTSLCDGTIRNMILSFPTIKLIGDEKYDIYGFGTVRLKDIYKFLNVKVKNNIIGSDNCSSFKKGDSLKYSVLTWNVDENAKFGENKGSDAKPYLILNINFTKKTVIKGQTYDNMVGISPKDFEGLNINDIIDVSYIFETKDNFDDKMSAIKLLKSVDNDLQYHIEVDGQNVGEINIPKDNYLKNARYDGSTKQLVFGFGTDKENIIPEIENSRGWATYKSYFDD